MGVLSRCTGRRDGADSSRGSPAAPGDVGEPLVLDRDALDSDPDAVLQCGRQFHESPLPVPGVAPRLRRHAAPAEPPGLGCEDLHERCPGDQMRVEVALRIPADPAAVGVEHGRVAQAFHERQKGRVVLRSRPPLDLQLDDRHPALVRPAEQVHFSQAVRAGCPERDLVVEQAKPAAIRPWPCCAETPEGDRHVFLRRHTGGLGADAAVTCPEVRLSLGRPAGCGVFQGHVLVGEGVDVDFPYGVGQAGYVPPVLEQGGESLRI